MKISQRIRRPAGWEDEDIGRIHAANTDILLVRRPVPGEYGDLVARGRVGEVRFQTTARGAPAKIDRGLDHLELTAPGRQRARLADDIMGLVCGMLAGFDWPRVEVRLDLADVQACPKFHCDNVLVRLVTTYVGPGTEYIETRRSDVIHRAAPGTLVFLKGHRHPTHRESILHRSPALPRGSRRLSVAIDRADWLTAILVGLVLVATGCSRTGGKLHGGAGSEYATEAEGIARELATFRAFLVPAVKPAPGPD